MNEAMITYFVQGHKLITDSLGITPLDEENERLYAEEQLHEYRVPVTLVRQGVVTIRASCRETAEGVVRVTAGLNDDELTEVQTTEIVGTAIEM